MEGKLWLNTNRKQPCAPEASQLRGQASALSSVCFSFFFLEGIFPLRTANKGMLNPRREDRCGGW